MGCVSKRIRGRTLSVFCRGSVLLLVVVLLLLGTMATATAQTATVVRVEDTDIDTDGSSSVPIKLEGSPGIVAMHIELTYDAGLLEWDEMEQGDLLAGNALVEVNADQPGRIIIGFATLDGASGDGELLRASFASTGSEGTTTLALENVQAWDANGFDVLIETQNGEVSIGSGFPMLLIIIIVAILFLLFLIFVGLLIWFLRRRRRDKSQPATVPAPVTPEPAPQPQPQPQPQAGQQQQAGQPAQPRFCSNCGQPLTPGAAFCSSCGTQVGQSGPNY